MQFLHQSTEGLVFLLQSTKFKSSTSRYTSYIEWLKFSCVLQKELCALLTSFLPYTLLTVGHQLWRRTGLSIQFITADCAEVMNERITVHSHDGTRPSELLTKFMRLLHGCPKFDLCPRATAFIVRWFAGSTFNSHSKWYSWLLTISFFLNFRGTYSI